MPAPIARVTLTLLLALAIGCAGDGAPSAGSGATPKARISGEGADENAATRNAFTRAAEYVAGIGEQYFITTDWFYYMTRSHMSTFDSGSDGADSGFSATTTYTCVLQIEVVPEDQRPADGFVTRSPSLTLKVYDAHVLKADPTSAPPASEQPPAFASAGDIAPTPNAPADEAPDAPEWYTNPPKREDTLYAVGIKRFISLPDLGLTAAEATARDHLAQRSAPLQAKAGRTYLEELAAQGVALGDLDSHENKVAAAGETTSETVETTQRGETYYALVRLSLDDAAATLVKTIGARLKAIDSDLKPDHERLVKLLKAELAK